MKRRIVVKVGSNVLTRPDGRPNVTNMSAIVDQIAALRALIPTRIRAEALIPISYSSPSTRSH